MRWLGPFVALSVLCAFPWQEARGDCAPPMVRVYPQPGSGEAPTRLQPNPTLFAVWPDHVEPKYEILCETTGEPLRYAQVEYPGGLSASARGIRVETGDCSRLAIETYWRPPGIYEIDPAVGAETSAEQPLIVSAKRKNERYGCGPSSHLEISANVDAAVVAVEIRPNPEPFIVPLWENRESNPVFVLGRTMCTQPNVPLASIDEPMELRITAHHADGSSEVGPWHTIRPPAGQAGAHDVEYLVERVFEDHPAPPPEDLDEPNEEPDPLRWLWALLALPAAGGLGLYARARARNPAASAEGTDRAS